MHLWFCHIYYRSLYAVRKNSHCSKGAVSEEKGGGGKGNGKGAFTYFLPSLLL